MKGLRFSKVGSLAALGVAAALLPALLSVAGCGGNSTTTTTSAVAPSSTTTTSVATSESSDTTDTTGTTAVADTTTTSGIVIDMTTTTSLAETTTTTEALSSAEKVLANGHIKAMGFIDKVYVSGGKRYIRIDYAEMLTGQAAINAAAKDGVTLDGDWYISNSSHTKRTFEVSGTVAITTSTRWVGGTEKMNAPCTWNAFKSFWGSQGALNDSEKHLHKSPWWIERSGQVVVKIDEQYLE
jgi:hypothetical protein